MNRVPVQPVRHGIGCTGSLSVKVTVTDWLVCVFGLYVLFVAVGAVLSIRVIVISASPVFPTGSVIVNISWTLLVYVLVKVVSVALPLRPAGCRIGLFVVIVTRTSPLVAVGGRYATLVIDGLSVAIRVITIHVLHIFPTRS